MPRRTGRKSFKSTGREYDRARLKRDQPKVYAECVKMLRTAEWSMKHVAERLNIDYRIVQLVKRRYEAEDRARTLLGLKKTDPLPEALFEQVTMRKGRRVRIPVNELNPSALEKYKLILASHKGKKASDVKKLMSSSLGIRTGKDGELKLPRGVELDDPATLEDYIGVDMGTVPESMLPTRETGDVELRKQLSLVKTLNAAIPVEERVARLHAVIAGPDDRAAMAALKMVEEIEKQAREDKRDQDPDKLPGPLFVLPRVKKSDCPTCGGGVYSDSLPSMAPVVDMAELAEAARVADIPEEDHGQESVNLDPDELDGMPSDPRA